MKQKSNITKEQLERYIQSGKTMREMQFALSAGYATIVKKMNEYGLRK